MRQVAYWMMRRAKRLALGTTECLVHTSRRPMNLHASKHIMPSAYPSAHENATSYAYIQRLHATSIGGTGYGEALVKGRVHSRL